MVLLSTGGDGANWDTLMTAFMKEYYSLGKTKSLGNKISTVDAP
jgi:hypothetical protein